RRRLPRGARCVAAGTAKAMRALRSPDSYHRALRRRAGDEHMTYLLLQSRDPDDPMREHELLCFASALGVARGGINVVDMLARVPERRELDGARAVLMGGSGDYSCLDPDPWI